MFFIIGTRPRTRVLRTLTMVCWKCAQPAAHRLTENRNFITLFFIPLIPLGTNRRLDCLLCGASQVLTADQAGDIARLPETTYRTNTSGTP